MTALFGKNKNKKAAEGEPRQGREKAKDELRDVKTGEIIEEKSQQDVSGGLSVEALAKAGTQTHRILKGFYVSEKASLATKMNNYIFKVSNEANKSEVKKEVARLFNVKIKNVRMLNMPEKRRDFGKHPGARPGFKKAIVVLEEGYTIGQAKP